MTNGNNLAFPSSKEYSEGGTDFLDAPVIIQRESFGLTKREYFAARAMQGMLSACNGYDAGIANHIAECAVIQADALIKQLNS